MRDRLVWTTAAFLCALGITVAINRTLHVADGGTRYEGRRGPVLRTFGVTTADTASLHPATVEIDRRFAARPLRTRIHVVAGALFLLAAPFQFWRRLRNRQRGVHRWTGRVLLVLLAISVLASLHFGVVDPFAGAPERIIVALVATLTLGAAGRAYWAVRTNRIDLHREWMLRAFALAVGIAVVRLVHLVLLLVLIPWHVPVATVFVVGLWIGWGATIAFTEWWIHATRRAVHAAAA